MALGLIVHDVFTAEYFSHVDVHNSGIKKVKNIKKHRPYDHHSNGIHTTDYFYEIKTHNSGTTTMKKVNTYTLYRSSACHSSCV
jgi:hypothetical protein